MNPTAVGPAPSLETATTRAIRRFVFWGPAATAAPGDDDRLMMPEYVWAALYGSDDVAQAIGSQLTEMVDVQRYESVLQRPVRGLYANLYGGEVHRLLAPEIANLSARIPPPGTPEALGLDPALYEPNWPDRHLLHAGIPQDLVSAQSDQRLLGLVDELLPGLPGDLRLVLQIREQRDRRMGLFLRDFGNAQQRAVRALAPLLAPDGPPNPAGLRRLGDVLSAVPTASPLWMARLPHLLEAFGRFDRLLRSVMAAPASPAQTFNLPLYTFLEEVGVQINTAKFSMEQATPGLRRPFRPSFRPRR